MGIEYSLRFAAPDADRIVSVLRRLPNVRETPLPDQRFDLGCGPLPDDWPAAMAAVDVDGVYFCDNCGGTGPEYLGVLVALLVGEFGAVTVEEL